MNKVLLFIGAFALLTSATAQSTYYDYDPDEEIHATYAGESVNIDFDNDQNPELTIYGTKHDTTFSGFPVTLVGFAMNTYGNTEVVGRTTTLGTETVLEADTILVGSSIDGAATYVNSSTPSVFPGVGLTAEAQGMGASVGQFAGAGHKYIGVKFEISGATHYGWIRVSVSATHDTCVVDSYAYETTAATGIDAGDMGGSVVGITEPSFAANVIMQNDQFKVSGLNGGKVTIYNILGEIEMSRTIAGDQVYLPADKLSSGVYLVSCKQGSKVITYKVFKP